MRRYNLEFKELMLKKVFARPDDVSICQIAREANMPNETLFGWISKSKRGVLKMKNGKYTNEEKFQFCLNYFNLPEDKRGEFLRANGLYSYDLDNWKEKFINNQLSTKASKEEQANKKTIKELKKELRRKEKALAETATLLTLKKKYLEIFEDEE